MKQLLFSILTILFLAFSCTPKVTQPTVMDTSSKGIDKNVDATCRQFKDLGYRKEEALEAFVIYRDFLRNRDFDQAYDYWKTAMYLAPGSDGRKTYHFDDGVKIYAHFYKQAENPNIKKAWADSLIQLYERRKTCFGSSPDLAARQGFDLYYNFKEHVDTNYIFNLFKQTIDAKGDSTNYFVVNPFVKMLLDKMVDKTIDQNEAKSYANQMWRVMKYGRKHCEKDCAAWDVIESYAPDRLEALEAYPGFYDCSYYVEKYVPLFNEQPSDCDVITEVLVKLKRGGCAESDPNWKNVLSAYNTHCRKVEGGVLGEAKQLYLDGKFEEAIDRYDAYLNTATDVEQGAKVSMFISKIYYRDLKRFSKSREYALRAAKLKPNWGEPYILIGKLYASSGPICGPGTGWDSQIVTWPAIDKWQYAKKIDPNVRKEANTLINRYEKFMPSLEDIFSRTKVKMNGPFYVGCWIKENTTVRAAK